MSADFGTSNFGSSDPVASFLKNKFEVSDDESRFWEDSKLDD